MDRVGIKRLRLNEHIDASSKKHLSSVNICLFSHTYTACDKKLVVSRVSPFFNQFLVSPRLSLESHLYSTEQFQIACSSPGIFSAFSLTRLSAYPSRDLNYEL